MQKLLRNTTLAALLLVLTACATGSANPFVGTWDTVASTPVGDQPALWVIAGDGTGVMSSDQGDQTVDGIVVDGNNVSFEFIVDAGGQTLALSFNGVVDGDSLIGTFGSDFGDFPVSGTRR